MKCPFCGFTEDKVIDSRPTEENEAIRRRRECNACKKRFTTYEKIEKIPVMVIKKDKTVEAFDRNKLINGMLKACEKRPVNIVKIEKIANEIESKIHNSLKSEVSSTDIGEMVMEKLKDLDEVAYVRFASVYRQFKDVNTFMEEIKNLKKEGVVKSKEVKK
ncbi:MAG: transcriptional regulator NrdR [Clostridia bacterium]|jgi:transcriptional repressor NrdR